jgi:hypothetical protein
MRGHAPARAIGPLYPAPVRSGRAARALEESAAGAGYPICRRLPAGSRGTRRATTGAGYASPAAAPRSARPPPLALYAGAAGLIYSRSERIGLALVRILAWQGKQGGQGDLGRPGPGPRRWTGSAESSVREDNYTASLLTPRYPGSPTARRLSRWVAEPGYIGGSAPSGSAPPAERSSMTRFMTRTTVHRSVVQ